MTATREKIKRVIAIASVKGGGGKSTIASNLAVAFQSLGCTVLIIDADTGMNTSAHWGQDRDERIEANPKKNLKAITTVKKTGKVAPTIREMAEHYDVVLVDTGAQDSSELRGALVVADVLITPVEVSQAALDGIAPLMELVELAQQMNEDLYPLALLSRVPPSSSQKRLDEAYEYLRDAALEATETIIYQRVAYPDAHSRGLSVLEYPGKKAKDEIMRLTQEIITAGRK